MVSKHLYTFIAGLTDNIGLSLGVANGFFHQCAKELGEFKGVIYRQNGIPHRRVESGKFFIIESRDVRKKIFHAVSHEAAGSLIGYEWH